MCNYKKILTITLNVGLLSGTIAYGNPHYCPKCKQAIAKEQRQREDPIRAQLLAEMDHYPPTENLIQCTCGAYFNFENEESLCPQCRSLLEEHPEKRQICDKCGCFFYDSSYKVDNGEILCIDIPESSSTPISRYASQPVRKISKIANGKNASTPTPKHRQPPCPIENSINIQLKKNSSWSPQNCKKYRNINIPLEEKGAQNDDVVAPWNEAPCLNCGEPCENSPLKFFCKKCIPLVNDSSSFLTKDSDDECNNCCDNFEDECSD